MRKDVVLVLIILIVVGVGAYVISQTPAADVNKVRAYADPIAENILIAMNEGNYTKFSRDLDATMKNAMTEPIFQQTVTVIKSKVGNYISKEFSKAELQGNYTVVYYKAKYTEETEVTVRVVFAEAGGKQYVSGLWFDSPKLRS
ncbi:MAG: DUF3887 domain-containing protein [Candidatus Methanomethyliaceae archaeon]|nr:DUF3887 domain-containing protein [Candidatus Methanomethyliaceae archaeon]